MERISDEEKKPFLGDQSPISTLTDEHETARPRRFYKRSRRGLVILFASTTVVSLLFNVILLLHPILSLKDGRIPSLSDSATKPFSPADPFTAYELKSVDAHDPEDKFLGPPGPEFDHAWSDLLTAGFMRITPEELRKAGKQSVRLEDSEEESYMGYLEVYHQLHCVKRMVQNRWPERYPELHAIHAFSDPHFNHCIQVLRKGIMCNGDTSLNTFRPDKNNATQLNGISNAPRRCINWDLMDSWARSRAVGSHFKLYPHDKEGWLGPN